MLSKWLNLKIVIVLLVLPVSAMAQRVSKHGNLHIDGTMLKDERGNPVVLRGLSFGWHNWWPRFYTPSTVQWLRDDWNCNVVRAAMGVEPDNGYLSKPEWSVEKVKSVVDGAISADIYVIIDWHSHNINLEESKKFFSEMAGTYGKYPNVIYEIFNEPDQEKWDDVKTYSIEIIKTIREKDPDNIILVGSPHWDQDLHVVADAPISGFSNLMYTMHFYAATHKKWLRDRCDYALSKGIPLFVSECAGMDASGDGGINEGEWSAWIEWMEQKQISWVTWSISDKNETCSMLTPSAASDGNWRDEEIKSSGLKTREYLKRYSTD